MWFRFGLHVTTTHPELRMDLPNRGVGVPLVVGGGGTSYNDMLNLVMQPWPTTLGGIDYSRSSPSTISSFEIKLFPNLSAGFNK